jgi:hypothetical protein
MAAGLSLSTGASSPVAATAAARGGAIAAGRQRKWCSGEGAAHGSQLHLQPADLLEQLSFLGLHLLLVHAHLAPGEQLAGVLQQLLLPLADLDRVDRANSKDN